jgi:hypothetical protein
MNDRLNARRLDQALHIARVPWQRSVVVGLFLFILPPTDQLPYRWQAAVVFALLVAWCYRHGTFARRNVQMATLEAIPTLWLSLKCTQIMVFLFG